MQVRQLSGGVEMYGGLSALPGYETYEYQLVWAIPDSIKDRIRKYRQEFESQFRLVWPPSKLVSLPIVRFRQRALLEGKLRTHLYQVVSGWRPFQITLKDFGALPSHSIYIPVAARAGSSSFTGFHTVQKELKGIQQWMRMDKEHQPFFTNEHKIELASKLAAPVFEKAWNQYAHRKFTAQFLADACLLLRRKPGAGNWQIVQRFELRDLPVGVQQKTLFDA